MLNTPSEFDHTLDSQPESNLEEIPEEGEESQSVEDEEQEEGSSESEESGSDEEVYEVGDIKITPTELKRLQDRAKNLESGYTKQIQANQAEHKEQMQKAETLANALEAQAKALKDSIDEDEDAIDWDDLTAAEVKKVEKKFKVRRKALEDAEKTAQTARATVDQTTLAQTNQVVLAHFSEWQGKDDVRQKDLADALKYAKSIGHTDESISLLTKPEDFIPLIEAAKYHKIKNAKPSKKEVVKKPKATKTRKAESGSSKSMAEILYGN